MKIKPTVLSSATDSSIAVIKEGTLHHWNQQRSAFRFCKSEVNGAQEDC